MKKTTLSLAVSLILFGAYTPAFAIDEPASNDDTSVNIPPPPEPDGDYPPIHEGGESPPPDTYYNPHPDNGELPPEGEYHPPHLYDYELDKDQFEFFDAEDIRNIDPNAFRIFESDDFAKLPPEAMSGLTPEQFEHVERGTLEGMSEHQFNQLPAALLGNINPENIGGFRADIVHQFRPEHFQQFKPEQFEHADPRDVFKMIANSNPDHIRPEHFHDILPVGWTMDADGLMDLPEGEHFALPPISRPIDLPPHVVLPEEIPDLDKGLGLGGQGKPLLTGLNAALAHANLPQFNIFQDAKGIMQVTGSDQYEGTNLAFMPDMDNMKQGEQGAVPGLSLDKRGLFVLTTPDGQMMPIRPVPKDVGAIKDLIPVEGGEVKLGKDGDVFLNIPEHEGKPPRCDVGIFNPIITPAPEGLLPGIHFHDDPTGLIPATIVYDDGTAQTMNPTVPSPEDFIGKAKEFEGVDNTQYNNDGTIGLTYEGIPVLLNPTFNIAMEPLHVNAEKVEPSITLLDGEKLQYRHQQGDQIAIFTVNINITQ